MQSLKCGVAELAVIYFLAPEIAVLGFWNPNTLTAILTLISS